MSLNVVTKMPSACTPGEIAIFKKTVMEGGQVYEKTLDEGIKRAKALAFAYHSSDLAGVGALKIPTTNYKNSVFEDSHSQFSPSEFPFELGYISVLETYRGNGYSKDLVKQLLEIAGNNNTYATTHMDNIPMLSTLKRFQFVCEGDPYRSTRDKHWLKLFVRRNDLEVV